jgi:hypothetical protein
MGEWIADLHQVVTRGTVTGRHNAVHTLLGTFLNKA